MSSPNPDPTRLGPYELTGRLSETPAGIVYLGVDPDGNRVSVAVLTRGAAGDAAARDRFRAAITEAREAVPSRVVAAQPYGYAAWAAVEYDADRPGAERLLDVVLLSGPGAASREGTRRGPRFQPHWIGSREPAIQGPGPASVPGAPGAAAASPARRGLATTGITLAALLAVLLLAFAVMEACQPITVPDPLPTDLSGQPVEPFPPPTLPTPIPSPTQTPHTPSVSPSPSQTLPGGSGRPAPGTV